MSRVTEAAYLANNGIIVTDPNTGELRPAGQYSQNEWRQLSKANPDLATALIENRSVRKDRERAYESKRSGITLAGGLLAGAAAAEAVGQARVNRALTHVLDKHADSLVPLGTEIYTSPNAQVFASAPGVVEFRTIDGLDPKEGMEEALRARGAFREFKKKPEGQKLFRAVPDWEVDPMRAEQKADIYKRMGFNRTTEGVMRLDNRKGAEQFGDLYRAGDRMAGYAGKHAIGVSRGLRYGGAALAGLALGGLAHGAWNMINPIQEVQ
jgi:hypothetical protein